MKLLEVKNNLAKISYKENERLALGEFIAISDESSYVGQIVNLTAELSGNFAIAKLIFTFNNDGIVNSYDGTIPSVNASLVKIKSKEVLELLPVERPVTFGHLAQQTVPLKVDETIFEKNLIICAEKHDNIYETVDNSIVQLEKYNEKIVVIDTDSTFADCENLIRLGRDFKLPLNLQMIDYILNIEDADIVNKAVIEDIFEDVREYAKTVEFIPFDLFVDVVSKQYDETSIPELALLKGKLIKLKEANIFAQNEDDLGGLKKLFEESALTYISITDIEDSLQTEVINYIHKVLDEINLYIFLFVKLNNKNSNKKLLKRLLDNEHIFTSIICSHSYKYLAELKQRAENMILYAPQTVQHDFANYNTLLNKLNAGEFIVYGALTQHVPLIAEYIENTDAVIEEPDVQIGEPVNEPIDEPVDEPAEIEEVVDETVDEVVETNEDVAEANTIEPIENILEDTTFDEPEIVEREELEQQAAKDVDAIFNGEVQEEISNIDEPLTEDDLDFIEELNSEDATEQPQEQSDEQLEDPLDEHESEEPEQIEEEQIAIVEEPVDEPTEEPIAEPEAIEEDPLPVFPAEENDAPIFEKGDTVTHPKYGKGVVEKLIKYGNKTLCSISFEEIGRRLLDPAVSELSKI